jgi:hypothetical protein
MEIQNREELEAEMRQRARLLSAAERRELAAGLGNPPDVANVPESFWQKALDNWEALLIAMLVVVFARAARQHGANAGEAEKAANSFAGDNARPRAALHTDSVRNRLEAISREWRARLEMGEQITWQEIEGTLQDVLGADELIATGFTLSSVAGAEWAARLLGLTSPEDKWRTNPHLSRTGPCEICRPLHGLPRSIWARTFPTGPPLHARCVCDIVYVNIAPRQP